jgi:hypothetical protein
MKRKNKQQEEEVVVDAGVILHRNKQEDNQKKEIAVRDATQPPEKTDGQANYDTLRSMAEAFARSKLFGVQTPDQALALMLVAQSEGRHPASIAAEYNIIQNRPALKSDAMLSRFQAAGGKVNWEKYTDKEVVGVFSHPQGGNLRVSWDMQRAMTAGVGIKENYKKYPRQMLRARCISEGVRSVFPAVLGGMYTPEEVADFEAPREITEEKNVVDYNICNWPKSKNFGKRWEEMDDNDLLSALKFLHEKYTGGGREEMIDIISTILSDREARAEAERGEGATVE